MDGRKSCNFVKSHDLIFLFFLVSLFSKKVLTFYLLFFPLLLFHFYNPRFQFKLKPCFSKQFTKPFTPNIAFQNKNNILFYLKSLFQNNSLNLSPQHGFLKQKLPKQHNVYQQLLYIFIFIFSHY